MIIDSQMTELGYSLKSYRVRSSRRKYQYNPFMGNKSMQTVNGITADSI